MAHQVVLAALGELPIARQLTAEQLTALAAVGTIRDLATHSVIGREGERTEHLWLVISGRIALSLSNSAEVRHAVTTISRGEFLGWSALVPGMFEQAQAEVLKPSRCIGFDATQLMALCERDPVFGFALMRLSFAAALLRLYDCQIQLADLYAGTD